MKKVLHLINSFSLAGAEKLIFDITKRIDKSKIDCYVCAISKGNSYNFFVNKLNKNKVSTFCLYKGYEKDRFKSIYKLVNYIYENDIDYIHTHCSSPDFYGKIAGLLTSRPVYSTIHNSKGYSRFLQLLFRSITKKYIAISKQVKKYMINELSLPNNRIKLIFNGVDISKFKEANINVNQKKRSLGIPLQKKVIINVGRITEQKGQKTIIEAARKIVNKRNDIIFLIVGDKSYNRDLYNNLKKKIDNYNLKKYIRFTGIREDVNELLAMSDVFVLPSIFEGLPITLLEAIFSKIPIVASDVGGNRELIKNGESGYLIPTNNSVLLAKKIINLLNNENVSESMVEKAYNDAINKFDIRTTVAKYEKLYA